MALATLAHIPAQHHSTSTSTTSSTTTSSSNTSYSSRWRKGLALFQKSRSKCWSPMTLAAATEKYVRHKSSPEKVVKCEDLTAREFAQLTGIKIVDATCTSPPLEYNNETTTLSNDSCSAAAAAAAAQPRIWDSDFWQQEQQQQEQHCSSSSSSNTHHHLHHHRHHHHHHHHHEPPNPRVIMKGRFKIMMGEDDEDQDSNITTASVPVTNCARQVVEWKRKRSA